MANPKKAKSKQKPVSSSKKKEKGPSAAASKGQEPMAVDDEQVGTGHAFDLLAAIGFKPLDSIIDMPMHTCVLTAMTLS